MIACILTLAGCTSSTRVETSWTAPGVTTLEFEKILVVAAIPDGALRRTAEEALLAQIPPEMQAVASYNVVANPDDLTDRGLLLDSAEQVGADGIVVLRPVGRDTQVQSVGTPFPAPYWSFGGYYSRGWGLSAYYGPEITSETIVGVETNIYRLPEGDLVWSAYTETVDPDDITELVQEVANAVSRRMQAEGLIPVREPVPR